MNEYKLYNLDRFESKKKQQGFEDISKDKKALKEAEDMWEDDEGNTRRDEAGARKDSADEAGESRRIEKGEQVMVS